MTDLGVAAKFAARELRGGARGFRIFLACIALGVGAIAASGSVAAAFQQGIDSQSREILGGDLEARLTQARADEAALATLASFGAVSEILELRAMARTEGARRLVEARGVDDAFPLVGEMGLRGETDLARALVLENDHWGVAVAPEFLVQFDAQLGDRVQIGELSLDIRAVVEDEPDRLALGFALGPRVMMARDALLAAGVTGDGALFRAGYRVALADPDQVDEAETALSEALKALDDSWRVRGREDAADGLRQVIDSLSIFLAVVGLSALIAGGVGVSQAVNAYVEARTGSIAALKALGADAGLIRATYALQIAGLALAGCLIGVAFGAGAPFLVAAFAGDALPVPVLLRLYPAPLVLAAGQGVLAAAAFALPAIGRARNTPPAALFRGQSERKRVPAPQLERVWALGAGLALGGLAILTSPDKPLTAMMIGGALVTFLLLTGAALLVMRVAKRLSHSARGFRRLALANLGGPGSVAPIAAPALGLGLALAALVTLVEVNLVRQVRDTAPQNLPALLFVRIPGAEAEAFDAKVAAELGPQTPDSYLRLPVLTGRITTLKGEDLVREKVAESERWILGETQITILDALPENSEIEAGEWWPRDYAGPPLIALEGEAARGLGVGVGDRMGLRILGRQVEAEIAVLRTIDWGGFGAAVAIAFAPGTLEAANPTHNAVLRVAREDEDRVADALGRAFPD
ncbi:MAG: ABC transporter permease, partial [Maricaulaceae bacterium]